MALDIYVGSLTRYYAQDWETAGARVAREMGASYEVVLLPPKPAEDAVTDPAVVQEAVVGWRMSLEAGLRQHLTEGLSWDDEAKAPYFTDRPSWEGYAGVLLLAAHAECPDVPRPESAASEWDADAAYQRVTSRGFSSRFPQIYDVQLWLPCRFSFKFKAPDVAGAEVWIGSSVALLDQLALLNGETFRVGGGGPFEDNDGASAFDKSARFGLEMFLRLARFSVEHRLPMKLDY